MGTIQYKPVAIQDECFISKDKKNPEITVLIKLKGQGNLKKFYKTDVMSFKSRKELSIFIKSKKLKILPNDKFKQIDQVSLLIKSTSQ